jgi:predicted negative regulator of RcsB-dependent stress response
MENISRKKIIFDIIIVILVFGFVFGVLFLIIHKATASKFACAYPQYKKITNAMAKEEVQKILGGADKDRVKQNNEDYFGQGQLEADIKEGWIYDLPNWDGGLEIYFNKEGKVIGKGCGNG